MKLIIPYPIRDKETRYVREMFLHHTEKYGRGIFAGRSIKIGEIIWVLRGETVTCGQITDRIVSGKEAPDDPLQVGRRTYIDLDEFSRSFNHSCDPNAGVRKRSELFALRDIEEGEQITYDYSVTIAPTVWGMDCRCGSSNCRKIIHDIRSVPPAQLQRYVKAGAIQRYMKPLLKELRAGTYRMPDYEVAALKKLQLLK